MTIVASQIVQVVPSVVSSGGTPVSTEGLFLTSGTRVPIGMVLSFPSASSVGTYFGLSSTEYAAAAIYFAAFTGSSITPASLLLTQYPVAAVAAYLRGGNIGGLALSSLQALTGVLTLTVNGTAYTSASITLSSATSFSAAATLIQAAFTSPPFTVTYDSLSGGFVFTASTTGSASTITVASGTLSSGLLLTTATAALTSQGATAAVPGAFMTSLLVTTTNWGSFMTLFNPDSTGNANKLAFATWNGQQANQYIYVAWDTDPTAAAGASASCLGALLTASSISGSMLFWGPDYTIAAFACGIGASINFTQYNGRITYAFKSQSGLVTTVNDPTTAANLMANGYNFYGGYALAANNWTFLYPGTISGPYKWADSYINQMWLNDAIQLSLMTLLTTTLSVPYNAAGYALIDAGCQVAIQAGVYFGAIGVGVPPSALEAAEINNAAGISISPTLATRGWYLQINPASAQTRGLRQSPGITFWYMDRGAVQQIVVSSVEVQ